MSITRVVPLLVMLVLPRLASAEELASLAEARMLADNAVALFKDEKFAEGYGLLTPYWPLEPAEINDLVGQTLGQWPIVQQRFGTAVSTEFVSEASAGNSFVRYTYLHKFQNHAIRWIFTFYSANDTWVVNGVSFDDQIDLLFDSQ
ncbi:MAG TPA: hypothetical protein VMR74_14355 [Gammaproteobacteria bacterium]|nr:hypothetical protein [Gammaproteobacteria bacterium]